MFTGLVQAIGAIESIVPIPRGADSSSWAGEGGRRLLVSWGGLDPSDVSVGDSIALNGACMTVLRPDEHGFAVDVSAESLARTCGLNQPGPVHLEKALRANDRLGGHLVSGHVDCVGAVVSLLPVGESYQFRVRVPPSIADLVAEKGSLAVHGVSLTLNSVEDLPDGASVVSINLIPHTLSATLLGRLQPGDGVNLEADLIARQVVRALDRLSRRSPRA